jgi:O-methyltransferase
MRPNSLIGDGAIEEMCEYARAAPEGCFVEFGVYRGGSAFELAKVARERGQPLYLYDTFDGMPFSDDGDSHKAGEFADTSETQVKAAIPDAIICKGVFPDSIVEMPPIAFVHVDCDQYRSVKSACEHFAPLMARGGRQPIGRSGSRFLTSK